MAAGSDPNAAHRRGQGGITLREGMALHVKEMRDQGRAEVSIRAYTDNVPRLLSREIDRPLAELTVEAVQLIKERGGEHRTMTNRLLAYLSAIWNTTRRVKKSTFKVENPIGKKIGVARYVLTGKHKPEQPRVRQDDMPEWLRRVGLIKNPLRRDLQMLALCTGMRDLNVRTLRWDVVDWKRGGFVVPQSKTTPFTIPFSRTVREILEARRAENPMLLGDGDGDWIFPSTDMKGNVIPVRETKEYASDRTITPWRKHGPESGAYKPAGKRVALLPGLHTLRRTFLSVAADAGVPKHVRMLLSNHSFTGRDVHEEYLRDEWANLVRWVGVIDDALWEQLGGRQARLRADGAAAAARRRLEPPAVSQASTAAR
jgi:integrase